MKSNGGDVSRNGPLAQKIEDTSRLVYTILAQVDQGSWNPRTEQNLAMTADNPDRLPMMFWG
jgi:hypothetical protein